MSRSNPEDRTPHPCQRWFEWNGETGSVRYYDKNLKINVDTELPFYFIPLDRLATIQGWHDASKSGVYSNEVRDTRSGPFIVKSFKGGILAEGLYANIKEKVTSKSIGGHFTLVQYMAFKMEQADGPDLLTIGSIAFKGAALSAWMEFEKTYRNELETSKGAKITSFNEFQKGKITYQVPVFELMDVSTDTNTEAIKLDATLLQPYFKSYFKRARVEQAEPPPATEEEINQELSNPPPDNDDNPF